MPEKEQLTIEELETIKIQLSGSIYYDDLIAKIERIIQQKDIDYDYVVDLFRDAMK